MIKFLKKIKNFFIILFLPLIGLLKNGESRARVRYTFFLKKFKVRKKTVLYESFHGKNMSCNPYALFKELLSNNKYDNYIHIWVFDDLSKHQNTIREYNTCKNVYFVKYNSKKYLKYLATSEYLINNTSFPPLFVKRKEQIYVNTWHGVPLKCLGFDINNKTSTNIGFIRDFYQSDYMISANSFLTKVYQNSYKLKNLYNGKIIEEGYPRVDNITSDKNYVINKLIKDNVYIDKTKKIILYAPTWKGTSFTDPVNDIDKMILFKKTIEKKIDIQKYQILIKPHNSLLHFIEQNYKMDYIIPISSDANEILSITDILISDYSSIFYDFLKTKKPILFYITDADEYLDYRGTYHSLDELPTPYTNDINVIIERINNIEFFHENNLKSYLKIRNWCEFLDEKNISSKIIEIVFENQENYNIIYNYSKKTNILFNRGEILINGITMSLQNLLNSIDYDKYDISIYVDKIKLKSELYFLNGINKNIRVISKYSVCNTTIFESIQLEFANNFCKYYKHFNFLFPNKVYKREIYRMFGNARFDYVFDFDGYDRFGAILMSQIPCKKRGIWLHSDMFSEFNNKYYFLKYLFSIYGDYDMLISCSMECNEINKRNLRSKNTFDKFTFVTNLLGKKTYTSKIKHFFLDGEIFYQVEDFEKKEKLIPAEIPLSQRKDRIKGLNKKNIKQDCNFQIKKTTKFITVGRCSPEKNHISLIEGFEMVLCEDQNCLLYIVGEGMNSVIEYDYIKEKKLEKNIIMTGNLKNPLELMRSCDCFILPSLYEGQGLVVLEARLLNMPIILTDFDSVSSVCLEGGQIIVGKDKNEIYRGLKMFLDGHVPINYNFNPREYNTKGILEFEKLISS